MTEKRFTLELYDGTKRIKAIKDYGEIIYPLNLVEIMNELYEENQALKSDRARYEEECRLDVFKELTEENEQLREHFIYLIGTALEDKECRKIYAKGLLEIFDDCANLDEAKIKIKEYLE